MFSRNNYISRAFPVYGRVIDKKKSNSSCLGTIDNKVFLSLPNSDLYLIIKKMNYSKYFVDNFITKKIQKQGFVSSEELFENQKMSLMYNRVYNKIKTDIYDDIEEGNWKITNFINNNETSEIFIPKKSDEHLLEYRTFIVDTKLKNNKNIISGVYIVNNRSIVTVPHFGGE
jgi:hypothetical protein